MCIMHASKEFQFPCPRTNPLKQWIHLQKEDITTLKANSESEPKKFITYFRHFTLPHLVFD